MKQFIFIILFLISCSKEKNIKKTKEPLIFIELNDTLKSNYFNRGEFKILSFINDSLKKSKKDPKFGTLYINISDRTKDISEIQLKDFDTFYGMSEYLKDTLIIPYYAKTKIKGNLQFNAIIDIEYTLNAYKFKDTIKRRVIVDRYEITLPVYFKDKSSKQLILFSLDY